MKIIMESWKRFVAEQGSTPEQAAASETVSRLRMDPLTAGMTYEEVVESIKKTYAELHPEHGFPSDLEVEEMVRELDMFEEETTDELAPDDYANPPGYVPGEGGEY